jgi:hypothetical protein
MLQRSLVASQTFARTLLGAPLPFLNCLTFPIWSGWFHSTLLVIKIIVLRQAGNTEFGRVKNVPHTVGELLPQERNGSTTGEVCRMTSSLGHASLRDGSTTAETQELISLLLSLIDNLQASVPQDENKNNTLTIRPFLAKVARLQKGLLDGIKKMTSPSLGNRSWIQQDNSGFHVSHESGMMSGDYQVQQFFPNQQQEARPVDYNNSLNFGYFDSSANLGYPSGQQPPVDDWLWDMVINDGNMFTM